MKRHLFAGAAILLSTCMAVGMLVGCTAQAEDASRAESPVSTAEKAEGTQTLNVESDKVKDEDLDAGWDEVSSTSITFEGDAVSVKGDGAEVSNSVITITQAGTYILSGTADNMQLVVNAPKDALVRLVLNNASIHCENSAPINCEQADKLLIILAEGITNTLTDGKEYTFPDTETDEPSAALFSKADLTINGTGTLKVEAAFNNGIGTKDDLIIISGNIEVTAANHAIRGRDSVTVLDGTLTLAAGNDGIQSNNDSAEDKGWIELYGGTYNITAEHDGIQAITSLTVFDGEYNITTGGGAANAPERVAEDRGPGGGGFGNQNGTANIDQTTQADALSQTDDATTDSGTETNTTTTDGVTSSSYKGVKAGGNLVIQGGSFTIDSADDAFHSNANITVSGRQMNVKTGDDAYHADADLLVEGEPVIKISECYEGLEGSDVTVKGGELDIVASDDGINAAGGSDSNETTGGFGPDNFTSSGDHLISIEGGGSPLKPVMTDWIQTGISTLAEGSCTSPALLAAAATVP